jgi:hypothetical protein|tara:strand:- start:2267 stop:2422 length:156 start_codon:yes stop_codon:yes gene_type:complete
MDSWGQLHTSALEEVTLVEDVLLAYNEEEYVQKMVDSQRLAVGCCTLRKAG